MVVVAVPMVAVVVVVAPPGAAELLRLAPVAAAAPSAGAVAFGTFVAAARGRARVEWFVEIHVCVSVCLSCS